MNAEVTMYSTRFCPYCMAARQFLGARGIDFDDIPVDGNPELRAEMSARAGQRTVPQIWIGDTHIGGFTDMMALDRRGELDLLLGTAPQS